MGKGKVRGEKEGEKKEREGKCFAEQLKTTKSKSKVLFVKQLVHTYPKPSCLKRQKYLGYFIYITSSTRQERMRSIVWSQLCTSIP